MRTAMNLHPVCTDLTAAKSRREMFIPQGYSEISSQLETLLSS